MKKETFLMYWEAILWSIRINAILKELKRVGVDMSILVDITSDYKFGIFEEISDRIVDLVDAKIKRKQIAFIIKSEFSEKISNVTREANES